MDILDLIISNISELRNYRRKGRAISFTFYVISYIFTALREGSNGISGNSSCSTKVRGTIAMTGNNRRLLISSKRTSSTMLTEART
jgi:hypothetical protein